MMMVLIGVHLAVFISIVATLLTMIIAIGMLDVAVCVFKSLCQAVIGAYPSYKEMKGLGKFPKTYAAVDFGKHDDMTVAFMYANLHNDIPDGGEK